MSRFLRVLLISGLPLGALVGVGTAVRASVSWPDLALTSLVSAGVIGSVLGFVACATVTRTRRRPIAIALFLLGMAGVGGLAAGAVYVGAAQLPHGRWDRLAVPPEPLAALAGPACFYQRAPVLYARARSRHLYRLVDGDASQAWERTDSIPGQPADRFGECRARSEARPLRSGWPPGHVVASHWIRLEGVDCGGRQRHVLLDDGTVWRWTTYSCAIGEVIFFGMFLLIAVGWSLVVALLIVLRRPPIGWPRATSGPIAA
jgi:hypothetical protein